MAWAMARPMPFDEPVTRAVCEARENAFIRRRTE
jgi:hypothetical protein